MPHLNQAIGQFFGSALNSGVDLSDAALLERYVLQQDQYAFELLVRRHSVTTYRVCRAILRDHHAAEDATQAVFLILAKKAGSIRNRAAAVGWLVKTARRLSLDTLRRGRKLANLELDRLRDDGPIPDLERERELNDAINTLSERYRVPILLCCFENLTHVEAAQRLGWPLGTLNTRLSRAKALLERELHRRGVLTPTCALATVLTANECSARVVEAAVSIVRPALAFAVDSDTATTGLSPAVLKLAQGALKTMLISRCMKIAFCFLCCAGISLGAFYGFSAEPLRQTNELATREPISVLGKEKPSIDSKTIKDYQKRGATYGGFVENPIHSRRDWRQKDLVFVAGDEAAKIGLPGFCWYTLTKEEFELRELPNPEVPFGLELQMYHPRKTGGPVEPSGLSSAGVKELALLKNLSHLVIESTRLDDEGIKELAPLVNLKSLALTSLTSRSAKTIAELPNLTSLDAYAYELTIEGIKELARLKKLSALRISMKLSDEVAKELSSIKSLSSLTLATFPAQGMLTDVGVNEIAKLRNLTSLALDSPWITDESAKAIASLRNLQSLALYAPRMTRLGVKELCQLQSLTTLSLNIPSLGDTGIKELAKLKKLSSLTLGENQMSDLVVKELTPLKRLNTLDLGSQRLTDEGIGDLSVFTELTSLTLRSPRLTDEGVQALHGCKNLTSLTLTSPKLTDDSIKSLTTHKNLKSLTLHSELFSSGGLEELGVLKKLTLIKFNTSNVKLWAEWKTRLEEILPNCSVINNMEID